MNAWRTDTGYAPTPYAGFRDLNDFLYVPEMTLYITRHGQTEENLQMLLQGHMPGTLTEKGKEQVRQAARRLAEEHVPFRAIVCSDLKRAVDSAAIIAERLHLPAVPMKELRECDWGEYTGMPVPEAAARYKTDGKWMFPGNSVETETALYRRAYTVLQMLRERFGADDRIIVVTHGLFARYLIARCLKCTYSEVPPFVNAETRTVSIQPDAADI